MTSSLSSWRLAVRIGLAIERPVWAVVIVIVLPLAELLVEEMNVVGDAIFVEQLVELLIVDPVRPPKP